MKKSELRKRITEIVGRLKQLNEEDFKLLCCLDDRSLVIKPKERSAYGKRYEEREKLIAKLKNLSSAAKQSEN
jgi:hypothetical protein